MENLLSDQSFAAWVNLRINVLEWYSGACSGQQMLIVPTYSGKVALFLFRCAECAQLTQSGVDLLPRVNAGDDLCDPCWDLQNG